MENNIRVYLPRSHANVLFVLSTASTWPQSNLKLQCARLLNLLLVQRFTMHTGHMRLVLNLIAKGACEFLRGTFAFLAQEMLLSKMIGQVSINAANGNRNR